MEEITTLESLKKVGFKVCKPKKGKEEIIITLKGDCNDGDYNMETTEFSLNKREKQKSLINLKTSLFAPY